MSAQKKIWLLVEDLLFISKVTRSAKSLGYQTQVIGRGKVRAGDFGFTEGDLIVIDLDSLDWDTGDILSVLSQNSIIRGSIVCFVSHVRSDLIAEARRFEGVEVLSRSQFIARLGELLAAG